MILVIVLAAGLIIGFFIHHYYSQLPITVHLSLFILLNMTVELIICLYGLNLYPLQDDQAIKWSVFTIVLLFTCSSVIQTALYFNHFIGIFITALLTVLFMPPLLSLVLPNFNFEHPFTTVYLSIQYGNQEAFYPALVIGLSIIVLLNTIPYMLKMFTLNREMAHEK